MGTQLSVCLDCATPLHVFKWTTNHSTVYYTIMLKITPDSAVLPCFDFQITILISETNRRLTGKYIQTSDNR
jgi:hypothetical protein